VLAVIGLALPTSLPVRADKGDISAPVRGQRIVRTALSYRGCRYRFGGNSRSGFDCSGFTKYLYGTAEGVGLPRTAAQQFRSGQKISRAKLQPGDLLFFSTRGRYVGHVGIYAGNGQMIHAANPRKGVTVSPVFAGYYARRLVGIRRPVG
jgi:cell wall-associated NlpC family hydrolase